MLKLSELAKFTQDALMKHGDMEVVCAGHYGESIEMDSADLEIKHVIYSPFSSESRKAAVLGSPDIGPEPD